MTKVLVTGGTGMLGTRLVPALAAHGHDVRFLSRSPPPEASADTSSGATTVRGDVLTGEGLDQAIEGARVVVHAATNAARRARATEVDGTRHLLQAAQRHDVDHFVYVSIVGVDSNRLPYYKAKWEAEQLVEQSEVPWTIQRITQFHDLIDRFLGFRFFPRTPHMAFQSIDVGEAASRLAEQVDLGPRGRATDAGGPEILPITTLRDERVHLTGKPTMLFPSPAVGPLADFDAGHHLSPDHRYGTITWADWLAARAGRG